MQEEGGLETVLKENVRQERVNAVMDFVGGQLRGEREVNPSGLALFQHPIGRIQRCFGFAHPHRGLKDIDARPGNLINESLLHLSR